MGKSKEAMARLFTNVFVCRVCKSKIRSDAQKVKHKKVKCRKCFSKQLRLKNKEARTSTGASAAPKK